MRQATALGPLLETALSFLPLLSFYYLLATTVVTMVAPWSLHTAAGPPPSFCLLFEHYTRCFRLLCLACGRETERGRKPIIAIPRESKEHLDAHCSKSTSSTCCICHQSAALELAFWSEQTHQGTQVGHFKSIGHDECM